MRVSVSHFSSNLSLEPARKEEKTEKRGKKKANEKTRQVIGLGIRVSTWVMTGEFFPRLLHFTWPTADMPRMAGVANGSGWVSGG